MAKHNSRWDLFISHAREDKETIVKPLVTALRSFGLKVWYDEFTLKPGDSLSRSIDQGLARSKFGIVVLSPAFFAKRWPEYELRGLTAREIGGKKTIIPIWHNVDHDAVLKFSPPLADKFAIAADRRTPAQLAIAIIEVTNPELFERIHRRLASLRALKRAKIKTLPPEKIAFGPIRHAKLPSDLIGRIRLVRAALLGIHTHSMKVWLDGFQRDAHPSKEIAVWERISAIILEYAAMTKLTSAQIESVFAVALGLSFSLSRERVAKDLKNLPSNAFETLSSLSSSPLPTFDIDERLPTDEVTKPRDEYLSEDREHFPHDVPDDILKEYLTGEKTTGRHETLDRSRKTTEKRQKLAESMRHETRRKRAKR